MHLTTIILTFNEERHIKRSISSAKKVSSRVVVVDSGSEDKTIEIAKSLDVAVLVNPWTNHAAQFNWALEQLKEDTDWVMRLDADEYLSSTLMQEIKQNLSDLSPRYKAICISRRMAFMGQTIRFGGVFPIRIVRLIKFGYGFCENRLMDEHLIVNGDIKDFVGEIVDDNRNSLTSWIEKHNKYSTLEVVESLNCEFGFLKKSMSGFKSSSHANLKRWIKEKVYSKIPLGLRPLLYFLYRYILYLGFLDGVRGAAFHFFQGFWYRYLVDMKLLEVRRCMINRGLSAPEAIKEVLDFDVEAL